MDAEKSNNHKHTLMMIFGCMAPLCNPRDPVACRHLPEHTFFRNTVAVPGNAFDRDEKYET